MLNISAEYLLTSFVVVIVPGTGVIYTLCHGLFLGRVAGVFAAIGCTLGIVPHLLFTVFGLAALLHATPLIFQLVKYLGVAYIFYLAWGILRESGPLQLNQPKSSGRLAAIVARGILINVLNPKLLLFFLAFLPQFMPPNSSYPLLQASALAGIFIFMTLAVFIVYAIAAAALRPKLTGSDKTIRWLRYGFAAAFAILALRLIFAA